MSNRTVAILVVLCGLAAVPAMAVEPEGRPRLEASDAATGCPAVGGAFVALLDPGRGMLLLSAAPFPGGRLMGAANGGALHADGWRVERVAAGGGPASVWGATYGFLGPRGRGCVAFDHERFSAEGDLASYLRWLAETVYLELPAAERERYPAFALYGREVCLRVEQEGFEPMRLVGREGSTLAFRVAGRDKVWLLLPVVLDPASSRLALRLAEADASGWGPAGGAWREWLVATPAAPLLLADPPVRIVVEALEEAKPAQPSPAR